VYSSTRCCGESRTLGGEDGEDAAADDIDDRCRTSDAGEVVVVLGDDDDDDAIIIYILVHKLSV